MKVIVTVVPRNLDGLASEAAGNGGVNFHQGEKGRHRKMEGKDTCTHCDVLVYAEWQTCRCHDGSEANHERSKGGQWPRFLEVSAPSPK